MKYSPDGNWLVVSSHDNFLYLYDAKTMKTPKKFGKSSSFITQVDWSLDSQFLRTNDASYELLYYDLDGT